MANWNSSELQTPEPIKKIGENAQNVINNLDILLKIVKGGANVAKLFLLLSNPAGAIIKLAANEIIKLCNDFKEIGVFYLFINPNDEGYGGQTSREFGIAIKQDKNGLYMSDIGEIIAIGGGGLGRKTAQVPGFRLRLRGRFRLADWTIWTLAARPEKGVFRHEKWRFSA